MAEESVSEIMRLMDLDLISFAEEMGEEPEKLSEETIQGFIQKLDRNHKRLSAAADREIEATMEYDEKLERKILHALFGLKKNDLLNRRIENLGNVLMGLWKSLDDCETDLIRLKKRVKIRRKDDPELGQF